jgi:hypothetical protein
MNHTLGFSGKKKIAKRRRSAIQVNDLTVGRIVSRKCAKFRLNSDQVRTVLKRVSAQVPGVLSGKRSTVKRPNRYSTNEEVKAIRRIGKLAEQEAKNICVTQPSSSTFGPVSSASKRRSYLPDVKRGKLPSNKSGIRLISTGEALSKNVVDTTARAKSNPKSNCSSVKVMASAESVSAADFVKGSIKNVDINIVSMDLPIVEFSSCVLLRGLMSLNLSRLDLTDEAVDCFISNACLTNLRWLDLSGNRNVTKTGVISICKSVSDGLLPKLEWLNLIGTGFDATPYIDGHYWRISNYARQLIDDFGYQYWMMLGSRQPEMENSEVLTTSERRFPPGTFRSA